MGVDVLGLEEEEGWASSRERNTVIGLDNWIG